MHNAHIVKKDWVLHLQVITCTSIDNMSTA